MPELPEVETVRRGLASLLPGKVIKEVVVYNSPRSFPNSKDEVEQFLYGSAVKEVRRRAKVLIIDLSSDYSLVVHLKMTGQLVFRQLRTIASLPKSSRKASHRASLAYAAGETRVADFSRDLGTSQPITDAMDFGGGHPNDSLIGKLPDRSSRVQIDFTDGSTLFFNDQRKFGWVKLLPSLAVDLMPFMQKLGPEPLEETTEVAHFVERIRRRNGSMIKPAFLDQSVIAGVGNIYADEALWAAKIHPESRVRNVDDERLKLLFKELVEVLNLSIEKGGSTDRNYVDAEGKRGSYLNFAKVFRREGQACYRHPEQLIEKIRVGGRGTHFCPECQKLEVVS